MTRSNDLHRRGLLRIGAAGAVVGMLGALAGCEPQQDIGGAVDPIHGRQRSTFLFVHGGWSSGFNFHQVVEQLETQGHRALAIDLPKHGTKAEFPASYLRQDIAGLDTEPSPLANVTLDDNVSYTIDVVERLAKSGPIVLVGHSLGGVTIGMVGDAVPKLIRRIVYLAAFMPVGLPSVLAYGETPEAKTSTAPLGPLLFGNPQVTGAARINWRSTDPAYRSMAKAATFGDSSDTAFTAFANAWQSDESAAVLAADGRPSAAAWGAIPRTYVRFTRDEALPLALQDRMIDEADALTPKNSTDVRDVVGSHLGPFVSATEIVRILTNLP